MLVTVDEAKLYLRLDGTEEDALIQTLLETAESLCKDIVRTDIDEMEEIARNVPLSPVVRPAWDMKVLKNLGFQSVCSDENVWRRVWSETEKVNYASTPMFMIKAVK